MIDSFLNSAERELAMMQGYDGGGHWFGFFMMMLLFWGVLIALGLALWQTRKSGDVKTAAKPQDDAMRILSERFARGEITEEQFKQSRDVLKGDGR